MRQLAVLLSLGALFAACDGKKNDPLPKLELDKVLPGQLLSDIGQARLEVDPTVSDPLTGLGACSDLITYCFSPGSADLDSCVQAAPRCTTNKPWDESACCPDACVRSYQQARRSMDAFAAFEEALYANGSCYPGVKELVP